jgi:predicted metal-dependent hydrolase
MQHDPRFLEGVELFNGRDFYKAHDPWESLWLERFGEEKDFIQGLILTTVALHHFTRGNLRGARSRFRLAIEKLDRYPETYWEINLKNFRRRMNGVMHRLLNEADPPPLDVSAVPKLKFQRP